MFAFMKKMTDLLPKDKTIPGRAEAIDVPDQHFVNGHRLKPPFPAGMQQAVFGMGCFWGAERNFWQTDGRLHHGGRLRRRLTPNPTYEEVCSGMTGHTEVVLVVFDPEASSATSSCSRCSGRATTRRRGCARATTRAPSTARRSTRLATDSEGRGRGVEGRLSRTR